MALSANQGTATSSSLIDFSKATAANANSPYQYDLATTFTTKTCPFNDGVGGCWRTVFTKATNASTFEFTMFMASEKASEESGFRVLPGSQISMGFIVEKAVGYTQNHWGAKVVLQEANYALTAASALALGAVSMLF